MEKADVPGRSHEGRGPEPPGHRKRVRLPETRATGQQRWGGRQPWGEAGGDRVGVGIQFGIAVVGGLLLRGRRKDAEEGWAPAPLITRAICLQLHGVCFRSDAQKPSHLFPDPLRLRQLCWHFPPGPPCGRDPYCSRSDLGIHEAPRSAHGPAPTPPGSRLPLSVN